MNQESQEPHAGHDDVRDSVIGAVLPLLERARTEGQEAGYKLGLSEGDTQGYLRGRGEGEAIGLVNGYRQGAQATLTLVLEAVAGLRNRQLQPGDIVIGALSVSPETIAAALAGTLAPAAPDAPGEDDAVQDKEAASDDGTDDATADQAAQNAEKEKSIDALDLTRRTANILRGRSIDTVGELLATPEDLLMGLDGFGAGSRDEVRMKLAGTRLPRPEFTPIEQLGLDESVARALRKAGVITIECVRKSSDAELSYRGLSSNDIGAIRRAVRLQS